MQGDLKLSMKGAELVLLPERAIYWPSESILIVSDLHFGKGGHFRKSGIAVPASLHLTDFFVLDNLIVEYQPKKVLFLGDLFHSEYNSEWEDFYCWANNWENIQFVLVKGNHDILREKQYINSNLQLVDDLLLFPFLFVHEPVDTNLGYVLCGHVHPGIKFYGRARQSIVLPGYVFKPAIGYLPAFGKFTGNAKIPISKEDQVYVIAENKVIKVQ